MTLRIPRRPFHNATLCVLGGFHPRARDTRCSHDRVSDGYRPVADPGCMNPARVIFVQIKSSDLYVNPQASMMRNTSGRRGHSDPESAGGVFFHHVGDRQPAQRGDVHRWVVRLGRPALAFDAVAFPVQGQVDQEKVQWSVWNPRSAGMQHSMGRDPAFARTRRRLGPDRLEPPPAYRATHSHVTDNWLSLRAGKAFSRHGQIQSPMQFGEPGLPRHIARKARFVTVRRRARLSM
jgi:hypothetical protein